MSRRLILAALAALLASCSKDAPAVFTDPGGRFSCEVPVDWRVQPDRGGTRLASFHGPASGRKPFSAAIAVSFESAATGYLSPQAYWSARSIGGRATPLREEGSRLAFELARREAGMHGQPDQEVLDQVLIIPAQGGFFVLSHSAPLHGAEETAPAFRALASSFKP